MLNQPFGYKRKVDCFVTVTDSIDMGRGIWSLLIRMADLIATDRGEHRGYFLNASGGNAGVAMSFSRREHKRRSGRNARENEQPLRRARNLDFADWWLSAED